MKRNLTTFYPLTEGELDVFSSVQPKPKPKPAQKSEPKPKPAQKPEPKPKPAEEFEIGSEDGVIVLKKYNGTRETVDIPEGIIRIGEKCFYECMTIKQVKFPSSLRKIDYEAFYGCKSLKNVVIPNGVQEIGIKAFAQCGSLTSVDIPKSVTSIGYNAFANCGHIMMYYSKGSAAEKYAMEIGAKPVGTTEKAQNSEPEPVPTETPSRSQKPDIRTAPEKKPKRRDSLKFYEKEETPIKDIITGIQDSYDEIEGSKFGYWAVGGFSLLMLVCLIFILLDFFKIFRLEKGYDSIPIYAVLGFNIIFRKTTTIFGKFICSVIGWIILIIAVLTGVFFFLDKLG